MTESLDYRLLDYPDSPVTLELSPTSTVERPPSSPQYSMGSPSQMDFEEEPENPHIEPERDKQTDDDDMEEVFVFSNDKKYFEAICESFKTKPGNPAVCEAVVNLEKSKHQRDLLLEVAITLKKLANKEKDKDPEWKLGITNLRLHSKPCVKHIVNLIKITSSDDDVAVLLRNAGLEDDNKSNFQDTGAIAPQTKRKLEFWNKSMEEAFKTVHRYVHKVTNTNEKRNTKETIQAAKTAVACMAKENLMMKKALQVATESDKVFKKYIQALLNSNRSK